MVVLNQTLFDISFKWDRNKFEASRIKRQLARKRIDASINVQIEKQVRSVFSKNIEIEQSLEEINKQLWKHQDKLRILDNMIDLASQSLTIYFEKRMETVRGLVQEHCHFIQQILQEEAEHWKEIHAVLDQNLINPGDIRSRNNYPRAVTKSPAANIQMIAELDEEEMAEQRISKLTNGNTLTPLLTKLIRQSRLGSVDRQCSESPQMKINISANLDCSIPRKRERMSLHLLPVSSNRARLEFVDATYLVKPEETFFGHDLNQDEMNQEANGTYRAQKVCYQLYEPHMNQDQSMFDSHPNIPARLCFSPTILQEAPTSSSSTDNNESFDENERKDKNRRFGQTFLLDSVKLQRISAYPINFRRPTISDENENEKIFVFRDQKANHCDATQNLAKSVHRSHERTMMINESSEMIPESNNQDQSISKLSVPSIKLKRLQPTKNKTKSVVITARKTRSATKELLEQMATTVTIKPSRAEPKRKIRKRKKSKSAEQRSDTTDEDEHEKSFSLKSSSTDGKVKSKRRKKSSPERSSSSSTRSKTRSRKSPDEEQEKEDHHRSSRNRKHSSSSRKRDRDKSNRDDEARSSTSETKQKSRTRKNAELETNQKKKTKSKSSQKDERESNSRSDTTKQYNTRSSAKRNPRSSRR